MSKALSGLMAGAITALAATSALAQAPAPQGPNLGPFSRDRNISVTQRARPGYDPAPIQAGGFDVLPQLSAGAEQDDNIYASAVNQKSDTVFTVDPRVDLTSNWSRNAFQAFVSTDTRAYARYTKESTTDYEVGGQGRIDAGNGQVNGGGDTGEYTEARTSVTATPGTKTPVRYQLSDGFASGMEQFNRVRLSARVDLQNFDYSNVLNNDGSLFLENYRNHTTYTYTGKAEYAVSPDTSVYMDASYNEHQYQLSPPVVGANLNDHGEQVNIGANFDLTKTVRGDVKIGYLKQDFAAAHFSSYSGMGALGKVEWFPDDLSTVTLTGSRQLQDSPVGGSPIYISGVASLQIDHELLRNLLLTGRVGYENDNYRGIDRTDTQTTAYVGAKYLMNRLVGFTLGYTYLDQSSSGAAKGPKFGDNRVTLSTTLKF
jgi:hypothetical protein